MSPTHPPENHTDQANSTQKRLLNSKGEPAAAAFDDREGHPLDPFSHRDGQFDAWLEEPLLQGVCTTPDPIDLRADAALEAVGITSKFWPPSRRDLRVFFFDGAAELRRAVQAHIKEWEEASGGGIRFRFTNDPNAEIRIAFQPPFATLGQFFAYIGTGALLINPRQPTVNLGFRPNTSASEIRRLTLHEVGHALGLVHEHQSPASGMEFRIPQVYQYFRQVGFSDQMTRENILTRYAQSTVTNSTFDPQSIMLYHFPASIVVRPPGGTPNNSTISEQDRRFIRTIYPPASEPIQPPTKNLEGLKLSVGAAPTPVFIARAGQQFLFHFQVENSGTYIIETFGQQAWDMTLSSTVDPGTILKHDTGGGVGRNARVQRRLQAGTYYVKVRHLLPKAAGVSFEIAVRKA